ncbi:hypothetical protein [Devosia sp. LjRoot3]|uniref:hypothetical protein n=1 Tax=Devosia sp. LjRoot3 TaxID=3342319 RepID=UPI003ED08DAA
MEDCVAEAPERFLGRPLTLRKQQPRIAGFIPDLIFEDHLGRTVIVEVQQHAMDRNHLYKCLEYRDSLTTNGQTASVVLVCEKMPERYEQIAKTHGVEVIAVSRENIVQTAVLGCPRSLSKHLLKKEDYATFVAEKEAVRPYAWGQYDNLTDVYLYTISELSRCGLLQKYRSNHQMHEILSTVEGLFSQAPLELANPIGWNIDNLLKKPDGWIPPHQEGIQRIRRPQAVFDVFVTGKDNLSVRWQPVSPRPFDQVAFDWVRWPSDQGYAYERPENELVFIHDIYRIEVDPDRLLHRDDGDETAAVGSMMLGLIFSMLQQLRVTLSPMVDCEFRTEFRLKLGERLSADLWDTRRQITGWRIVSAETLRMEEAQERLADFESNNKGFAISAMLSALESILGKRDRRLSLASAIAKEMRSRGIKVKAPTIGALLSDLTKARDVRLTPYLKRMEAP